MRILFQPYNTFAQNDAGGVKTKVFALHDALREQGCEVDFFDKRNSKVAEYDVLHFFKAMPEHLDLMFYAKSLGKRIVLSSIVPLTDALKIRTHLCLNRILPLHTVYELTERVFNLSDCIITESNTESCFLQDNYKIIPSKIIALPNGVNPLVLNGDPILIRQKYGIDKQFVLQVGLIDPNKNQLNTIKALKNTGVLLVIVGGPNPKNIEYERKCKAEAAENVIFTGWIQSSDPLLASAYAAAKTFVLPSYNEIYGNVVMEAGANGCSLSCSKNVPLADWNLSDCIDFFNPNSPDSIRNSIIRQFNKEVPESQVEFFKKFFSWKRIAEEHIKLYKSL